MTHLLLYLRLFVCLFSLLGNTVDRLYLFPCLSFLLIYFINFFSWEQNLYYNIWVSSVFLQLFSQEQQLLCPDNTRLFICVQFEINILLSLKLIAHSLFTAMLFIPSNILVMLFPALLMLFIYSASVCICLWNYGILFVVLLLSDGHILGLRVCHTV